MFIRKVIVQVDKNSSFDTSEQIKISRSLCKNFGLNNGDAVTFQFGSIHEEASIVASPSFKVPTIEITPTLAKKLVIPYEILPIHCLYNQDENTLKLGPIITCITNQMYHEDIKFGSMTAFFEELARFAKRHHIFFYIKPILKSEEHFRGYSFQHEEWQNDLFPEPDAVYNRIGSRSFEASEAYQQFTHFLEDKGVNYFNHSFLDKWQIHEALSSFPEVIPYLPNTALFDDYEAFAEKLTLYDCIFVKPIHGSQGRQILKIQKENDGFNVYYSSFSQEVSTFFKSSYLLYKRLKERLSKKPFIIQQGINLIHFEEDRPLDFRILCVRNEESQWKVISSVARISPKEKMVSNLAQGGEQKRPIDVLADLFDEKLARQYLKLMGELAVEVANLITESNDGLFGELGIDIALDQHGKLWIIEVNSKPSKMEMAETSGIRPSTKAILAYLAYLSGYPLQRSEKGKKER
ncbi:YheC/YheD family protein [Anaerobacillus sp. CMMVII]|uniref:YheC/YheD family endospore coat-associated protein n=1 Tax=Anaerobacillus sp. CMMVII TaxID=2755588 RepID=UPI0021B728BD|nr:YheC/YheD family protein [Anaerobacillus sp. CMMVII]MCT8139481.1 YheC/YheD family protein [Anaerobacillus sp. CMMVII]